jgi:glutathione S-transferase
MAQALRLYTFTLSHFCEKARWGLDRAGLAYKEVILLPGFHRRRLRRLRAGKRVPVLTAGDRVIVGSSQILDFVDDQGGAPPLLSSDPALRAEALEWERFIDREVGETLRLVLYYYALHNPRPLVGAWSRGGPFWAPVLYRLILPRAVHQVKRLLDINPDSARRDERRLHHAFQVLDQRLATRRFLVGDTFGRADLTLAALCAPLLRPEQHPWRAPAVFGQVPEVEALRERLRASPTGQHVAAAYARRRQDEALGHSLRSVLSV